MQNVSFKDVFDIHFLSEVKMSPDGKHAAFVDVMGCPVDNRYFSYIWLYSFENGSLTKLTASGDDKNIDWLDNEHLIFPASRNEKEKDKIKKGMPVTYYYSLSIKGGEASKVFTVPTKASKLKPLSNGKFLIAGGFDNSLKDLTAMDDSEKEKYLKEVAENNAAYKIFDEIPFWQNGAGVTNKKRNRLFVFDSASGALKPISAPLMNVMTYCVSSCGKKLVFSGVTFEDKMVQKSDLYVYDFEADKLSEVKLDKDYFVNGVEFLGKDILFFGKAYDSINSYSNSKLYTVPVTGGAPTGICDGDFSIGSSIGSDCKYGGGTAYKVVGNDFYYLSTRGYSSYLFKLSGGKETKVSPEVSGYIDSFDIKDGKAIYVAVRNMGLQEIHTLDLATGTEKCISTFNCDWIKNHNISYPEYSTFKNRDGVELDCFIIKPVGFDPSKKYPAILDMHGGPKATYGDVLFHEMQIWASLGYFVFFTNPRGSDGRGSEFANIVGERYVNWDYNDFMDFTDKVLEMCPQIDQDNVGVTGGSYGGLMTNWIVGQTNRFKAAATQRSIANFTSKCLTTDIGYYHNLDQMQTDPWSDNDTFWDKSPLKYADKCTTPLLFIHSDQDYRCYMGDALQFFTALKMHGCDSRFCLFHGENHELSRGGKPKNRIKRLEEITNWFENYMK